jgi:hypothetical protein
MKTLSLLVVITAATFVAGSAFAAPSAPRSAASLECSKEADAQGLHGKKRKEFRSKCKTGFKRQSGGQERQGNWGMQGGREMQGSQGAQGARESRGGWGWLGGRETQGRGSSN